MAHTLAHRRRSSAVSSSGWSFRAFLLLLLASTLTLAPTATAFATEAPPLPAPDVAASSTQDDAATEQVPDSSSTEEAPPADAEVTSTSDTGADETSDTGAGETAEPTASQPAEPADTGHSDAAKATSTPSATQSQTPQEVESSSSEADIAVQGCVVRSSKQISHIEFFDGNQSLGKDESISSTTFDLARFSGIEDVTRITVKSGSTSESFPVDCGTESSAPQDDNVGADSGDPSNGKKNNDANNDATNDNKGGQSTGAVKNDGTGGKGGGANSGDCAYVPTEPVEPHEPGTGKPADGSVGNADDKCPPGQLPDGSDPNAGYECDENQGVGKGNPAHTGCEPRTPPAVDVTIVKTNNADGVGGFSERETADAPGQVVPFRLEITNNSAVDVVITELTDAYPGQAAFTPGCGLIGDTLGAGDDVTCEFTIANYSPPAGEEIENTATVVVEDPVPGGNEATDSDNSVVRTLPEAEPGALRVVVDKTNDANGDTSFNDTENAAAEDAAVDFRAVITNRSATGEDVVIDSVIDTFSGQTLDDVCPQVIGDVLTPGQSVTCTFTVDDYAPAAGSGVTNTVTVVVSDPDDSDRTATDSDTSTVKTPEVDEQAPELSVTIDKTNDANGDATFSDSESARAADRAVTFRAVITNTSPDSQAVRIDSVVDRFGNQAIVVCDLVGRQLAAGASVTCLFTVEGYSPSAGSSLVNTLTVVVSEPGNSDNTARDADDSTVRTPAQSEGPELTVDVVKTNDANGDGVFSDSEPASAPGQDVDFQARITNSSAVAVEIESIVDRFTSRALQVCVDLWEDTIPAGQSVVCAFTVENYSVAGDLTNNVRVVVSEPADEDNTAEDSDTSVVTASVQDLRIVKVDGVDAGVPITPGDALDYTITVINDGDVPVSGFTVRDDLPAELSLRGEGARGSGFDCSGGEQIRCTYAGTLQPGDQVTITVSTTLSESFEGTNVVNTATVPLTGDPTPANNTDTETTPVTTVLPNPPSDRPDVAIVKDDAGASVRPGGQLTYTLTVTNQGTAAVSGVRVTDTLPVGLTLDRVSGSGFSCMTSGAALDCGYAGSLAPGASAVLTVVTTLAQDYSAGTVSNTAVVPPLPNETDTADNTSTERTPVTEVQGTVFNRPAPTEQGPEGPDTLPFTGAETDSMIAVAGLMLLVGVGAVLAGRRRPAAVSRR